jgi:SNF2 family DNA or RNA helicase
MALIVRYEPSFATKLRAFSYQVAALDAIKDLEYAAVFHEQGLGKTKIAIDLMLYWLSRGVVDSIIVFTKKGLLANWRDELRAHSYLEPRALTQDRHANFFAFNSPARVYLAHYEVGRSEEKRLQLFLRTRKVAALLDEAQKLKNPSSVLTQAFFRLAPGFARRVALTGTPIANRPFDLWAPVWFLDFGRSLGSDFAAFRKSLDLGNDFHERADKVIDFQTALGDVFARIRPFSVRETKRTAGLSLPTKHIQNIGVELSGRQAELYEQFREQLSAIVVKQGRPLLDDADEMLKRLLRLVEVASNPRLVDDSYTGTPAKLPLLEAIVSAAVNKAEKLIIWTAFTANVDWLARELHQFGAVRLHGKLSIDARNAAITRFKTDVGCRILVATPGAAKEGLTLTVANHAVFFDRSFSLDDYLQAQDRIHRISQAKECFVTNLVAENTVDTWVDVLLAAKQLAAQLGQGDITIDEYVAQASYAYGAMLREVLRNGGTENADRR